MSSLTKPNGPLPENTYWRRRAIVLAVALLLVVGLGRLFTGGSDAADPASATASDSAALVSESDGASSSPTAEASEPTESSTAAASESAEAKNEKKKAGAAESSEEPKPAATVEPQGECLASDVSVEPLVADQDAGRDIKVRLKAQTTDAVACLWKPSKDTLTLKITSGSDNIWFSSECPKAMPNDSVVLRNDKATQVRMTWDARRSDEGCTKERKWALPGTYHLEAAALGGDPQEARFVLEKPTPETVQPKSKKANEKANKKSDKKADEKKNKKQSNQKKKNNKNNKKND